MPIGELMNVTNEPQTVAVDPMAAGQNPVSVNPPRWPKDFVWATIVLVACFSVPLTHLAWFAATSELYSHILLVPFVSVYLAWLNRRNVRGVSEPDRRFAVVAWCAGSVLLAGYWLAVWSGWPMTNQDGLAWMTSAFVGCFFGVCGLFAGRETLRAMRFPLCFLAFMVPFPTLMHNWLESFLQRGSALTAYGLFQLAGTPLLYHDLNFQLPGLCVAGGARMQRHPFQPGVVPDQSGRGSPFLAIAVETGNPGANRASTRAVAQRVPHFRDRPTMHPYRAPDDSFRDSPRRRPDLFCVVHGAVLPSLDSPSAVRTSPGGSHGSATEFLTHFQR